jgi:hypothetical protein
MLRESELRTQSDMFAVGNILRDMLEPDSALLDPMSVQLSRPDQTDGDAIDLLNRTLVSEIPQLLEVTKPSCLIGSDIIDTILSTYFFEDGEGHNTLCHISP